MKRYRRRTGVLHREADFHAFVRHMATPQELRECKTLTELAAKLKVNANTFSDWKRREEYPGLFDRYLKEMIGDARPDILAATIKSAKGEEAARSADRKLFLTMSGDFVDKGEVGLSKEASEAAAVLTALLERGTARAQREESNKHKA